MPEVYRATEAFAFTSKSGVPRVIRPGDLVNDDDPDFKGREHLFEPAVTAAARATETASAAPGERRARSKPIAAAPDKQPAEPQPAADVAKPGDK